jgi:hypothetical protein
LLEALTVQDTFFFLFIYLPRTVAALGLGRTKLCAHVRLRGVFFESVHHLGGAGCQDGASDKTDVSGLPWSPIQRESWGVVLANLASDANIIHYIRQINKYAAYSRLSACFACQGEFYVIMPLNDSLWHSPACL